MVLGSVADLLTDDIFLEKISVIIRNHLST